MIVAIAVAVDLTGLNCSVLCLCVCVLKMSGIANYTQEFAFGILFTRPIVTLMRVREEGEGEKTKAKREGEKADVEGAKRSQFCMRLHLSANGREE